MNPLVERRVRRCAVLARTWTELPDRPVAASATNGRKSVDGRTPRMSKTIGFVVALVAAAVLVVLVAGTRSSDEPATPSAARGESTTTRPVRRATVPEPTSTAPGTTSVSPVPTATLPTVTLAPPFTSAQLEQALLQNGDLPLESRRDIVPPNAWAGVCGSSPPNFASPISAAAVDFNGSVGLHVREDLADYGGNAGGYLDAVRAKVACAAYAVDGQTSTQPVTVVPISPAVVAAGVDTRNGAVGFGVKTDDAQGRVSFHVWLRQGDLVISMQDDAVTATPVSAVQFAQLALERAKNTLA
jgi:hypothetical protein